ncbi:ribosome recycling factor [Candidatus Parcubacteria bacterium]|nr:ribosome recycling factor [Candidatus Parcubacteria bacterium]
MAYNFSAFKSEVERTTEWLKKEYTSLRGGQASPAVLDTVSVDSYGTKTPISHVASVLSEGPKSLRITPWDKSVASSIDMAIREANLGVSVSMDDKGLRVSFPDLTNDRRQVLIKLAKQKLEEARIALRSERQKVLNDLDKQEKEGKLSEDEKTREKNELQKLIDEANKKLEDILEKKEKEILE